MLKRQLVVSLLHMVFFALCVPPAKGQAAFPVLVWHETDSGIQQVVRLQQSETPDAWLNEELERNWQNGYLLCNVDSTWQKGTDRIEAYVYRGPKFYWAEINPGNVPSELIEAEGTRMRNRKNGRVSPAEFTDLRSSIVGHFENNGYPFAAVNLTDQQIADSLLLATFNLDKGPEIRFDSLITKGDARISNTFLKRFTGIRRGGLYDESRIKRLNNTLQSLGFVTLARPAELLFTGKICDVYVYLEKRKASSFNGILGLLPDPLDGTLLLTGDVRLNLINALGAGEQLNFNWRKLQDRTQQLDLLAAYPFLFGTPVGVEGRLNFYRRDTLFSQFEAGAAIRYQFAGDNFVRIGIVSARNTVITPGLNATGDLTNSNSFLYTVGTRYSSLNYPFNPVSGLFADVEARTGTRNVSSPISTDDSSAVSYSTPTLNLLADVQLFTPLSPRATVLLRFQGGWIASDSLYLNEVYRVGGIRDLRGFDDQSITASQYGIATVEARYLLEENSNIFAFFSQAYTENKTIGNNLVDRPLGFGAGINFQTPAGIFSLTYALGRQFDNAIQFRSAKIHFGFTSLF